MFLSDEIFTVVIDSAPLVSIELVVKNAHGMVLLGERKNRPAKGYWFVPGGRILKNESLADAFKRLTNAELGEAYSIEQAKLQGPYDHFYEDSVFGDGPSTHYVAIAYQLKVGELRSLPTDQHSDYRWFSVDQLLKDERVHDHTKAYFM